MMEVSKKVTEEFFLKLTREDVIVLADILYNARHKVALSLDQTTTALRLQDLLEGEL